MSCWSTACQRHRGPQHDQRPGGRHAADAVVLCTGGYGNVFFLSTNAMASNVTAAYFAAYKKGAFFANPCFTQIHPTCIPVHGTFRAS
jgi:succinate dehydrogenase / fumarate reductase flavoprotein subunit